LPSFLDTRRACGIDDFKTFGDLLKIFPKSYVELLRNVYDDVEDIDLYVGGALESFTTVNSVLVGETFGCIIGDQYRHTMGGDAYFLSHKTNPYPFTAAQLDTINAFQFNHLICTTSTLDLIQKAWSYVESPLNSKVPCSVFKPMDVSAWTDVEFN
jgi:peroxidase